MACPCSTRRDCYQVIRKSRLLPSWSPEDSERKGVVAATNGALTAWAGPWGVSFATNLTPDKDTGIAEWSETKFIQMARTGKHALV